MCQTNMSFKTRLKLDANFRARIDKQKTDTDVRVIQSYEAIK